MPQACDFENRYLRNQPSVTDDEQRALAAKKVCVCGCGGIGGYAIEALARLGVGHIVAVDPDRFEATNLNRQLLSTEGNIGELKAVAAQKRVETINSQVDVQAVCAAISEYNALELLGGCDIAIDALDSLEARFALEQWCAQTGTPLVHGAISGWNVQVTTIAPGSQVLSKIYPVPSSGPVVPSALAFTPMLAAAFEAAECAKVLLGKGNVLYEKLLVIDLLRSTQRIIEL